MKITLTKKQLDILARHFAADVNYGVGGTYGDGDDFTNEKEFKQAKELAVKLLNLAGYKNNIIN